jgi:hypothetical protein
MSAITDYPRELSLGQRRGKWVLSIHGPDVSGEAASSSREVVEAIAEAYAAMRRDTEVLA